MKYKITALGTHKMEKVVDTRFYKTKCLDTIIDNEDIYLREEYGKKYQETCSEVIIEELR
tara:strand:+ start:161 stop:340 length:180 start_codon:yes stop_codon:yes gene_type:complete